MQSNMKSDIHTRSWRDICFSRASSRMRCWKSFSTSLPGGLRIQVFMYVCTFVRMPVCISVCFSVREIYASRQTLCLPFCSVKYGLTQRRAPARTDVDMRNAHARARANRRPVQAPGRGAPRLEADEGLAAAGAGVAQGLAGIPPLSGNARGSPGGAPRNDALRFGTRRLAAQEASRKRAHRITHARRTEQSGDSHNLISWTSFCSGCCLCALLLLSVLLLSGLRDFERESAAGIAVRGSCRPQTDRQSRRYRLFVTVIRERPTSSGTREQKTSLIPGGDHDCHGGALLLASSAAFSSSSLPGRQGVTPARRMEVAGPSTSHRRPTVICLPGVSGADHEAVGIAWQA